MTHTTSGHGLSYFLETPLLHKIEDIYGYRLEKLNEVEKIAALHCATFIWLNHLDDSVKDLDAEVMAALPTELDDIMDGLKPDECWAFVQCLAESIPQPQ